MNNSYLNNQDRTFAVVIQQNPLRIGHNYIAMRTGKRQYVFQFTQSNHPLPFFNSIIISYNCVELYTD